MLTVWRLAVRILVSRAAGVAAGSASKPSPEKGLASMEEAGPFYLQICRTNAGMLSPYVIPVPSPMRGGRGRNLLNFMKVDSGCLNLRSASDFLLFMTALVSKC